MKRLNPSIRTQLLAWLVIPLLVLLLVGTGLCYGLAISLATDAYDKSLLDSTYAVANCVQARQGKVVLDLPPAALSLLKDDIKDHVYYQVLDQKGHLIAGDTNLPLPDLHERLDSTAADFRDDTAGGEDLRIASVHYQLPGRKNTSVLIQVAETMNGREQIADQILIGVVLPQLCMVLMSALVVWYGVSRGLRPLTAVRDAVAARNPSDMSALSLENAPKEVRPLVRAINDLLDRLNEDLQAQRRFVANAAHQLRTPIAGLKMQTELALRQKEPKDVQHALNLISTGADRAARLANQLLALARAEPGATDLTKWQPADLNFIARKATREFVPQALSKSIDLGFEAADKPIFVHGDSTSLHELAANLIENAVLYTKDNGHITVRVETKETEDKAKRALLIVEDNGPGIAQDERERVFERFYRIARPSVAGSGLGLAIVREIADTHGAVVSLNDGPGGVGTRAVVDFPLAPAVDDSHSTRVFTPHSESQAAFAAASTIAAERS